MSSYQPSTNRQQSLVFPEQVTFILPSQDPHGYLESTSIKMASGFGFKYFVSLIEDAPQSHCFGEFPVMPYSSMGLIPAMFDDIQRIQGISHSSKNGLVSVVTNALAQLIFAHGDFATQLPRAHRRFIVAFGPYLLFGGMLPTPNGQLDAVLVGSIANITNNHLFSPNALVAEYLGKDHYTSAAYSYEGIDVMADYFHQIPVLVRCYLEEEDEEEMAQAAAIMIQLSLHESSKL